MIAALPILAMAASAASPAAAPAPYPGTALLSAFRQACADLSSIDTAAANARKAGWQDYVPDKDSQVAQLLDFGMGAAQEISEDDPSFKTDLRTLRITLDGHDAELMLTGVTAMGTYSLGCRAVDFAAEKPLSDAEVSAFARSFGKRAGKPGKIEAPGVMSAKVWKPGLFPGHTTTQIAFVPQDSQMKEALHLSGINLMTQLRN